MLVVLAVFWLRGDHLRPDHFLELLPLLGDIPRILRLGLAWNLILACAVWLVFAGLGAWIAKRLRLDGMSPLEGLLVSSALGAGALSLLLLGLGLAGFWRPAQLRLFFIALLPLCLWSLRRHTRDWTAAPAAPLRPRDLLGSPGLALALVLLAMAVNVLATSGPEIFYDSLVYHLALPKLYLLRGRVMPIPENMYSGFPAVVEMLYGLALSLSNEHLCALLHCSLGMAAAAALWVWLRRHSGAEAGAFGVLLLYLCPIVLFGSWNSGADLGLTFFMSAVLNAVTRALEPQERRRAAWPVAAGLLLGFAMGVKYTAGPPAAALMLAFLWLSRSPAATGLMALAAGLAFLPWAARNLAFYGNPVYPFLNSWLGSVRPGNWNGFLADARLARRLPWSAAYWKDLLSGPWTISVTNRDIEDWLGAALVLFLPPALFSRWEAIKRRSDVPPAWRACAIFAAAGFLVWFHSSELVRFLAASIPFFAAVAALAVFHGRFPPWLRRAAWAAALLASLHNVQVVFRLGEPWATARWPAVRGLLDHRDYLKDEHVSYPVPYYGAMEFINRHLPAASKVLFLGEFRSYYCERDFIAAPLFDTNPFWPAARLARSSEVLAASIRTLGVTHIFLSPLQYQAYAQSSTALPRDVVAGPVFGDFWSRWLDLEHQEMRRNASGKVGSWLLVYRLRERPRAEPQPGYLNPWRSLVATLAREGRWQGGTAWR